MRVGDVLLESFAPRMQPMTGGDGVSSAGRGFGAVGCNRFPAPPPTTMTTQILQLSDVHRFADPDERLFGIPTRELFEDVLAHVERSGLRPDHVVVTGDHTHDELPETYAAVREQLAPFLDRLWLLPGNHDDRAVLRAAFDDRIPLDGDDRITFSFRAGDWLCLGLDTQLTGAVGGRLGAEQVDWIRAQLDEHRPRAAALFMHHPPVELGLAWLDRIGLEDAAAAPGPARRGAAHPARVLRPRPPRVVAPGRLGGGRHRAVDGSPVQPDGRRRRVRHRPARLSPDRARRRRLLDDGRPPTRGAVRADAAVTGPTRRVALVTGAGRGIGRASAIALAASGSPVVVAARSTDELDAVVSEIAAAGGESAALACDLTDRASPRRSSSGRRPRSGRSTSSSTTRASAAAPIPGRSPSSGTPSGTRPSSST